ncbi:MAG: STAS/SEC14 domain-containing protein, partial [Myxococcales bacterium]|nr:STAS/SEC14 domain-containing protein [Myxococcales bacterium]
GGGENLIAYSLGEGEVTDDELEPYWKRFDEAVSDGRKLRIYAEMHALPSFGQGLVVEKLKRLTTVTSAVERMAIVGDARWLAAYAKNVSPIIGADIRHFPMADKDAALDWVRE